MKKIAFLTSGGDSPGMNAAIRAITKTCLANNITPYAIYNGFQGLLNNEIKEFKYENVNNIIHLGGTIIGSARSKDFLDKEKRLNGINNLKKLAIEGLIVIGGDGSFKGAEILSKESNISVIGIPGTIDNDIYGTDKTIGYDTCLNTIIQAIDKIRDTANSHQRIFFIEVMGKHSGQLALNSSIAAGAEMVLIPEVNTNIEAIANQIKSSNKGKRSTIVVVAEGDDAGTSLEILKKIEPYLNDYDIRNSVLGYIQRGGSPSSIDRIMATRMGYEAVLSLLNKESSIMLGTNGIQLTKTPLSTAINKSSSVDKILIDMLHVLQTK